MLKGILILLAETPSSASARQYAFQLAQRTEAKVAGLAGIDLSYIEAPMLGRIGSSSYKVRLEEQLKKQAEDSRQRLHKTFEEDCRKHDVSFDWLSFDGDPIEALYTATETRDLVVTGHDTAFCGNVREQLSEVVAKVLLATPRPVIVCGDKTTAGQDVLIAYDGSVPAMRALQMFVLPGLGSGQRACVT